MYKGQLDKAIGRTMQTLEVAVKTLKGELISFDAHN